MKKIKSLLAILLAALMIMSAMPMTALADSLVDMNGETDKYIWSYTAVNHTLYFNIKDEITGDDRVVTDDLNDMLPTYFDQAQLDEGDELPLDGSLIHKIIIGNNILDLNYIAFTDDNYPNLQQVVFEENSILDYISASQFSDSTIKNIKIPNTVIGIDSYAFESSSLTSITLPDSVEVIGNRLFKDCLNLKSVDLSKTSITAIQGSTFDGCKSLTEVLLPETVRTVNSYAFRNTAITTLDLSNITKLGTHAFYNSMLKSADLSNLTSIPAYAFANCLDLTSVNLSGVSSVGSYAFHECFSLKDINFSGVTTIGSYAFADTAITKADLSSVNKIGNSAFYGCSDLTDVVFNTNGMETIDNYAFSNSGITSADLRNVKYIEDWAFEDCENLTSINVEGVTCISGYAFRNTGIKSVSITGTTEVYYYAFADCQNLERVEFNINAPDIIDDYTFENCPNLTEVVISPYVTGICKGAFKDCVKLSNVDFPTTVNADGETIGLSELQAGAFENTAMKSIKLPSTIEGYSFANSPFETYDFSEVKINYIPDNAFEGCENLKSFTVPDGCETIGYAAFKNCINLTEINLPDSLTTIADCAFQNCSSLVSIKIPDSVYDIYDGAFVDCTNLKSVNIPKSMNTIWNYVFRNCSSLSAIEIPEGVTEIAVGAFEECTSLTDVKLPESLEVMGDCVFMDCTSLKSANIPRGVTTVPSGTFSGCTSLANVTASGDISTIGSEAFYNTAVSDLSFAKSVTTVEDCAFADCPLITSIAGLTNLQTIGAQAFAGCIGLKETGDLEGVTKIGKLAFSECTSLETAYLPSTLTSTIGLNVYKDSTEIKTAYINSNRSNQGTFLGCTALETAYFGEECTKVPSNMFKDSGIKTVNFSKNAEITAIDTYAFDNCKYLTSINIPDTVEKIDSYAFRNCTSLTGEITIPESVASIGLDAFSGCTGVTNFKMPGETKELLIYARAFDGCTSFEEFNTNRPVRFNESSMKNSNVKRLVLGGNNKKTFDNYAFSNSKTLESVKINGTLMINDEVFYNIPTLTTLEINSANVSYSGDKHFYNSGIEEFNVPSGMVTIPANAFQNSANLKKIAFESGSALTSIGAYAFANCDIAGELIFPSTLTSIGSYAFSDNTHLNRIVLPAATTTLYQYAFYNCPLDTVVSLSNGNVSLGTKSIFYDSNGLIKDGTIMAPTKSSLRTYANNNGIHYVAITDSGEVIDSVRTSGTWSNGEWVVKTNDFERYEFVISGDGEVDLSSFKDADGNSITIEQIFSQNSDVSIVTFTEGITAVPDRFLCFDESQTYNNSLVNQVNTINLAPSVTKIGSYAFYGIKTDKLVIPETVTKLGEYAFANSYIYDLTITSGIKSVTQYAFYGANLTVIHIEDGVKRLEKACFQSKSNINKVYFPTSVSYIHSEGENSSNNALSYKSNVIHFYGRKNCEAYYFAQEHRGINYHLEIDYSTDFTHPANYTASGKFNTTSGGGTWYYVEKTKTIYLKGEGEISAYPNLDCAYDVETVVFETGLTGFSTYDKTILEMFNPTYVYFSTSFAALRKDYLRGCTNLRSLIIPDSVYKVDSNLLKDCENLRYIKFGGGMDEVPAEFCKNLNTLTAVDFGDGVSVIEAGAFENCTGLKEIILPYGIKKVGRHAFNKCVNVVKLRLNENLSDVGTRSFGNLAYCEEIEFNSSTLLTKIDTDIINWFDTFRSLGASTTGTTLVLGDGVVNANLRAFDNARITELVIGDSVSSIEDITNLPYLQEVIVSDNNSNYYSWGGALYSNDNCLVLAPSQIDNLEIKPGTVKIGDYAFSNSFIDGITIPSGVKEIGNYAFYNCKELETIDIANSVTTIGSSAFENCKSLRMFYSPSKLETIGARAFANCTHLGTAVLASNNLTAIGNEAFMGCSTLIGMVVPENVQLIGDRAYMNCPEMTEIYIWSAEIGEDAFKNDDKLTIFTMAGSDAYRYAREFGVDYSPYTDDDKFFDLCADKIIIYAGYLGYCTDGHGDIQWLTVYTADCENDGYMIGVCEYCSEIIDEKHIDATGHSYSQTADIPATENTKGMTIYTCTKCGGQYCDYTPATGTDVISETHTVTGSVVLSLNNKATSGKAPAKNVSVVIGGNTVATTDENGTFTFELETGSYEAELRYAYGFTRTIYIVVEDTDVEYMNIPIIACDFNQNGQIDDGDYELFNIVISSSANDPSYLDFVDMNNDGYINAKDRLYIKACYGLNAKTFVYPVLIIQK